MTIFRTPTRPLEFLCTEKNNVFNLFVYFSYIYLTLGLLVNFLRIKKEIKQAQISALSFILLVVKVTNKQRGKVSDR